MEKNRDTLTDDLIELLAASGSNFIKGLFPANSGSSKKASLSKQFQRQLKELMAALHKTEPHYIRCIKPNAEKSASKFTTRMSLEQLTYSGVFEAVAIRKQGFPFRLKHDMFLKHYCCIMPDPSKKYSAPLQGCKDIVAEMKLNMENVQFGTTQVLYRSDEHKALELQRSIRVVALEMDEELKRLMNEKITGYSEQQKEKYFEKLSRAVEQADEFRLKSKVSEDARKLLDDYIESRIDDETKAALQRAHDTCDEHGLRAALQIVDQHGYKTKLCKECRRLLERIDRINAEIEVAATTLDEFHVEACIKAGEEIGLSNDWMQYFQGLYYGPKKDYLEAMKAKAIENQNHDRAIRLDIKLKDIQMEEEADKWCDLTSCPRLKKADEWAAEKFMGKKADLAAGFMYFQETKIHTSMCKFDNILDKAKFKEIKAKAIDTYSFTLKYLGQRKSKRETGVERARQAVEIGLQTPELRDEIFVQLVKVTSKNPDENAVANAWDLMSLCLQFFPPSPELENYLEYYLRQNAPTGKQKHQTIGWLRQRVYKGQVTEHPTAQQLEQIEVTLETRSRGFSEPLPPGMPSWQDLRESYYDKTPLGNTNFRRELPKTDPGRLSAKPNASPAQPAAPSQKPSPWSEEIDPDSGETYYYNCETGESTWDKPPALMYRRTSIGGRGW